MNRLCQVTGKRCFASASEARRGMRLASGARLRSYLCPSCHLYHLSAPEKRDKLKNLRRGKRNSKGAGR